MEFNLLEDSIAKIKNLDLPGTEAHFEMAPEMRIRELEALRRIDPTARQAGVMTLCYPGMDGKAYLILILRPSYPGVHANQVAFPGGQRESQDRDLLATALRETEEEVGIPTDNILPIRPLTPLYIPPSNYLVNPYLGFLKNTPAFQRQESEVADLIEVPLEALLDEQYRVERQLDTSYARAINVPAFNFGGQVVWGATAMMLNEFKWLLRASL